MKSKKRRESSTVKAIAAEMGRRGLSGYALAKLSGVPSATISRILTGDRPDPQISTVERLAAALGKSLQIR